MKIVANINKKLIKINTQWIQYTIQLLVEIN
jgi:hypothetical protein